jgi:hypothetical protein
MAAEKVILAHGGSGSLLDTLVGVGPVMLGGLLILAFILLLAGDRRTRQRRRHGYRDERPTSARLLFSGTYYELDRLVESNYETDSKYQPEMKTAAQGGSAR